MKSAIVIIGGGLRKNGNAWHTIDLGEGGDDFAASNDRWRVLAGATLWKKYPDSSIIVSGGKGQLENISDAPTISEVIKKELIELGVLERVIQKEEKSGNTVEQLQEIKKKLLAEKFNEALILSNEWHLPRIKALFEYVPGLKDNFDVTLEFISAEEILLKEDPKKWQPKIEEARIDPGIQKRVELENQGIEQLKNGTYKFSKFINEEK